MFTKPRARSPTDSSRWIFTITSSGSLTSHFPKRKLPKQDGKPSKKRRKKPSARRTGSVRAMLHIKPKQRRNAGRRMTVISTRSVCANNAAKSFIQTAQGRGFVTPTARKPISKPKKKKRYAEKGEHTFRQKVCKICGKPFWPSNGQEVLCSEECKTINRNQRQLAYYHRKQSEQKAGEAI